MAYKIVLDAGHGGTDPGAVYNGRNEKDDNLALAEAVGKILEDNGVNVVYTRTEDIYQTPFEKAKIGKSVGCRLFYLISSETVVRKIISIRVLKYLCIIKVESNMRWHRI